MGNSPWYPLNRRVGELQRESWCFEQEEHFLSLPSTSAQFLSCPAHTPVAIMTILSQRPWKDKSKCGDQHSPSSSKDENMRQQTNGTYRQMWPYDGHLLHWQTGMKRAGKINFNVLHLSIMNSTSFSPLVVQNDHTDTSDFSHTTNDLTKYRISRVIKCCSDRMHPIISKVMFIDSVP